MGTLLEDMFKECRLGWYVLINERRGSRGGWMGRVA
jgi:hypothetical protein